MPVSMRCAMVLLLSCSIGCATRGVTHVAPDESQPHFSWEIRTGGQEGDDKLVCGSAERAQGCTLVASSDKRPVVASVHLAVHPAAEPTSYLGFMRLSFFQGNDTRKVGEVNTTVQPGSRPVHAMITGQVTSKPGTYTLVISVDATQPGLPAPKHLPEEVKVTVRPS